MTAVAWMEELQQVAPRARVLRGGALDGYEVDGLRPSVAVQPADVDDVAAVLRLASERGLSVVPRGGGTMIDVGNVPTRLDVVLDLTRLDRIVEHRPQDLTATVEAGITVAALQRALAQHGQMLALDPPRDEQATVGGVLAANAWGPRRQRYGSARDLLIGSRAVLADGSRLRAGGKVVKNVAGYDLNKLLVGSTGTIGVIVEATFKVLPLPAGFGMLVAAFGRLEDAQAVALEIHRRSREPLTLDLIGPSAARSIAADSRAEPTAGAWLLAIELGGSPAAVDRLTRELVHVATAAGSPEVTALERGQRERLMQRLRDYGRSAEDPAAVIVRIAVLPSQVAEAVAALERAARPAPDAIIARAGVGAVYGYWEGDVAGPTLATMVGELRRGVSALGGTVTVERAPTAAKRGLDVWGLDGADVALMRRVKDAYDPGDLLSPGRIFQGSRE